MLKKFAKCMMFALAGSFAVSGAVAEGWPEKPVTLVIGQAAGGATDFLMRTIAEGLSKELGQPVVVENRVGAQSLIAATTVRNATPDGYTLYGGSATSFSKLFMKSGWEMPEGAMPVSMLTLGDNIIYARADLGVKTLKELRALANTRKLKYASIGGTQVAMMALVARHLDSMPYEDLPYKATDQAMLSLLSGDIDYTMTGPSFMQYVKEGKLVVLGTLADRELPAFPGVKPAKEQGVDVVLRWNAGLWAPLGTPQEVTQKIEAAAKAALERPEVLEKLATVSATARPAPAKDLLDAFHYELGVFRAAMAEAKLEAQ